MLSVSFREHARMLSGNPQVLKKKNINAFVQPKEADEMVDKHADVNGWSGQYTWQRMLCSPSVSSRVLDNYAV